MAAPIEPAESLLPPDDYWSQTRRPLVCLAFLLPLLAVYEVGVLSLGRGGTQTLRNGADVWMRSGLHLFGLNQPWVLPAVIVAGLLAWHVAGRHPAKVPFDTFPGMLAESVLFAFALVAAGQTGEILFRAEATRTLAASGSLAASRPAAALTFIGAGIYEEVLFRLCLLPALIGAFRLSRLSPRVAAGLAVLSTSLMFSLAHHIGPGAEAVDLYLFAFRTTAGVFFAALFLYRGFGITVGAHAAYDLIVGVALT
jgi:membrane protease YdiL (CAAX protease family)